jgi:hypothetical protein
VDGRSFASKSGGCDVATGDANRTRYRYWNDACGGLAVPLGDTMDQSDRDAAAVKDQVFADPRAAPTKVERPVARPQAQLRFSTLEATPISRTPVVPDLAAEPTQKDSSAESEPSGSRGQTAPSGSHPMHPSPSIATTDGATGQDSVPSKPSLSQFDAVVTSVPSRPQPQTSLTDSALELARPATALAPEIRLSKVTPKPQDYDAPRSGTTSTKSTVNDARLRRAGVKRFVSELYLSDKDLTQEQVDLLYAPATLYFGSSAKSRAEVLLDQRNYYKRWPERRYKLIDDSLTITASENQPRIVDVRFEYDFDVRSASRKSAGRGYARLTLDLTKPGGQIVRETGGVSSRVH